MKHLLTLTALFVISACVPIHAQEKPAEDEKPIAIQVLETDSALKVLEKGRFMFSLSQDNEIQLNLDAGFSYVAPQPNVMREIADVMAFSDKPRRALIEALKDKAIADKRAAEFEALRVKGAIAWHGCVGAGQLLATDKDGILEGERFQRLALALNHDLVLQQAILDAMARVVIEPKTK